MRGTTHVYRTGANTTENGSQKKINKSLRLLAGCVIFIYSTGVKHGLESQLEMLLYLLFLRSHSVIRNLGVDTLDTKKGQLPPESSPG